METFTLDDAVVANIVRSNAWELTGESPLRPIVDRQVFASSDETRAALRTIGAWQGGRAAAGLTATLRSLAAPEARVDLVDNHSSSQFEVTGFVANHRIIIFRQGPRGSCLLSAPQRPNDFRKGLEKVAGCRASGGAPLMVSQQVFPLLMDVCERLQAGPKMSRVQLRAILTAAIQPAAVVDSFLDALFEVEWLTEDGEWVVASDGLARWFAAVMSSDRCRIETQRFGRPDENDEERTVFMGPHDNRWMAVLAEGQIVLLQPTAATLDQVFQSLLASAPEDLRSRRPVIG